jgi:hypothetical protein
VIQANPELKWATDAIAAKLASETIGARVGLGDKLGGVEALQPPGVETGFVQRFENGAIYYTRDTQAHLVTGDIATKYEQLGGPTWMIQPGNVPDLGYPTADTKPALNNSGTVCDFQHGSVYWNSRTGPMLVHEVLKPAYEAAGWEAGVLGFPTQDTYGWRTFNPSDSNLLWGLFENGCIASTNSGPPIMCGNLDLAIITADTLKGLVRHMADQLVHRKRTDVGLHPQIDIVGVSDWQPKIDSSGRRVVTYRLYGFKTGAVKDTNVTVIVKVQFDWKAESIIDQATQTLVAVFPEVPQIESATTILGIPVAVGSQDFGIDAGDSIDVADVLVEAPGQQPAVRVVLDMLVTTAGDLQFFTNPYGLTGKGGNFGPEAQKKLDDQIATLMSS